VAEIVAVGVADDMVDEEAEEETNDRSSNAHTARWTIIPPKHVEWESTLKAI
jgi:hypothetical protein